MITVPSIHPAFLLHAEDMRYRQTIIDDFRKALALRKRKPNWDESVIWERDPSGRLKNLFPTLAELWDFAAAAPGTEIAVDVETTGEQVLDCQLLCVGMASSNGRAICVPLLRQHGERYWSEAEEPKAREILAWILKHGQVRKTLHNGAFDSIVLWSKGLPLANWTDDTLILHHLIDGELPHSLAYCASRYLEVPYWKDDVKGDIRWLDLPDETLRSYNLRDCLATLRVAPPMREELKRWKLEALYAEEMQIASIMAEATIRGITLDYARRDDPTIDTRKELIDKKGEAKPNPDCGYPLGLGPRLRIRRQEALDELRRISGDPEFNPRSVLKLRDLLFNKLKFPVVSKTKKGAPSTDKTALVLLGALAKTPEQKGALRNTVRYRKHDKMLGTYVEGLPVIQYGVDPDGVPIGRLHVNWRIGPVTGRLASSPNAQNWNNAIKRIFRARKGNRLVGVDLSQAELRGMAYYSADSELLLAYQQGLNVHTLNATLLFKIRNPGEDTNQQTEDYLVAAVKEKYKTEYSKLPIQPAKTWKKTRRLAKNFVFGDNYGAIAETILRTLQTERDPDTDEPIFADLTLAEVESMKLMWERLHPAIPAYWDAVVRHVNQTGHFRDPISGRICFFRGGIERNRIVNWPIQTLVASWMNKCTIKIATAIRELVGDEGGIILQVHDSIVADVPERFVAAVKKIMVDVLSSSFELKTPLGHFYPLATLPPDAPTDGIYLDEV